MAGGCNRAPGRTTCANRSGGPALSRIHRVARANGGGSPGTPPLVPPPGSRIAPSRKLDDGAPPDLSFEHLVEIPRKIFKPDDVRDVAQMPRLEIRREPPPYLAP